MAGVARQKHARSIPLAGVLAAAFLPAAARLPLPVARALGRAAGRAAPRAPSRARQVSRLNLALCLPELAPAERERVVRASLVHAVISGLELGALWHWPDERLAALEEDVVGAELLDRVEPGRGLLLLLPHLGNWELFNHFLLRRGPLTGLYRPAPVVELDRLIRRARERSGCTMAPATAGGVRQLVVALRRGETVAILPDQEPTTAAGIFGPFFSIPALTMTLAGKLADHCRPLTLLGAALRTRGGFRIQLEAAPDAVADPDPAVATAAVNLAVEGLVRRWPEQYLWSYKRFKTRPESELTPYLARSFATANRDRLDPSIAGRVTSLPKR